MDPVSNKRKAEPDEASKRGWNKKTKGKHHGEAMHDRKVDPRALQPGDIGIWATCAMKKEAKTVGDLRDLFEEYAMKMYQTNQADIPAADHVSAADQGSTPEAEVDIEAEINQELADIRKPARRPLFTSVKLDTQCLIFFRTRLPVEPVSFIERICRDITEGVQIQNCRYVKRLTPITGTEKANIKGLETVAKQVLAPHFHVPDQPGKKFAIRPSIRNNTELTREEVINTVAAMVGPGHKVDLGGYDLLILVEIYKNVVGMSVVGPDFEKFKRFNIDELRQIPQISQETSAARVKIDE